MTLFLDAFQGGDLDVFLQDFGQPVTVDGLSLIALVDDEGQGPDEARENVNVQVRRLVVREAELARPKSGRPMTLEGAQWIVSNTKSAGGFLEIQLYKEVS
ncbi:hypothetical protein DPQ33_16365 [Oceanidesulfovibrio indonesiensis]|uniref:Uncharacterized protein n=1 Tax=Oceanidesulfovibrio indonesiensis TaxID=54767 RepID=A0A7M3MBK0_9BACT|nr:hypothetical protein [Oceanidesulfovibrio indonesiensis]TVM15061.1 hypothetical protein DPQ33_16365 [Oceanidesulfovibrio indonesiensis]